MWKYGFIKCDISMYTFSLCSVLQTLHELYIPFGLETHLRWWNFLWSLKECTCTVQLCYERHFLLFWVIASFIVIVINRQISLCVYLYAQKSVCVFTHNFFSPLKSFKCTLFLRQTICLFLLRWTLICHISQLAAGMAFSSLRCD